MQLGEDSVVNMVQPRELAASESGLKVREEGGGGKWPQNQVEREDSHPRRSAEQAALPPAAALADTAPGCWVFCCA